MGRAICELFAAEGARVVVNYSASREAAEEVAAGIRANGGEAVAVRANVAVDAEARALIEGAVERWGRLDVLVNNAGWSKVTPHAKLDELTDEIWDRTLNVNLRGAFYCMRAAAPHLKQQQGAIVNIASVAADTGAGSTIVYAASKAGLISMTKSFARVLAPEVRVNALSPGAVHTRFAGWPEEIFPAAARRSPLKRIATVEEVAGAVLFLACGATAITGENLRIDSGLTVLGPA
ncbi:MAG: SDR family oxidoreductase [Acidobacteria bacterium]|nr:SDR family oxidoreductase [Acidobacteriota bacterium]